MLDNEQIDEDDVHFERDEVDEHQLLDVTHQLGIDECDEIDVIAILDEIGLGTLDDDDELERAEPAYDDVVVQNAKLVVAILVIEFAAERDDDELWFLNIALDVLENDE